ncbi:MAG: hypothetical protein AMXMBFR48_10620 [Ignavibacteriales bacterium]
MKEFKYWKKLHDQGDLQPLYTNPSGLLWVKTKSIIRKDLIDEFVKSNNIRLIQKSLAGKFAELFEILNKDIKNSGSLLDSYIKHKSRARLKNLHSRKLVSELYKLKTFEWGGDYQNSLDKYLVSHYVKTYQSYNSLTIKLETEIPQAVRGYVLNSWYNHWSSILIESIIHSHSKVLPTVGKIKGVDFFLENIPFDLKVTYLPAEYIKIKRKQMGLPVELTFIKQKAKEAGITYDKGNSPSEIYHEITEKMKDRNDKYCLSVLDKLNKEKIAILEEAKKHPVLLKKWLYENQGEMRFGSENRLFLILVDTKDFNNSWKLKRNIQLLKPAIDKYLTRFKRNYIKNLEVSFRYKDRNKEYNALSDIIFIVKK